MAWALAVGQAIGLDLSVVAARDRAPFHPGRCAAITLPDGSVVGHVGELHPKAVAALDLPAATVGGELDVDALVAASGNPVQAHQLSTFPAAHSDVALVVDESVPAAEVESSLREGAGDSLESVSLFDIYRGDQLEAGRKSLAYRLTFRADRTLKTTRCRPCGTPPWRRQRPRRVPCSDDPTRRRRHRCLPRDRRAPRRRVGARRVCRGARVALHGTRDGPSRRRGVGRRHRGSPTARIDLLVNNAGVIDAEVALVDSDPDQWWETVETNVRGPYLMTRAVLPHLTPVSGRIVNLNSGAAYRNADNATAYNLSKGALARLTSQLGLGEERTALVFDLAPGVVRTDMTESMDMHRGRTEWTSPAEVSDLLLAIAGGELDAWSGRMVQGWDRHGGVAQGACRGRAVGDGTHSGAHSLG